MTFWKTKDFKALQKEWYQRLEAEGFLDAEKLVGDDMKLIQTWQRCLAYSGGGDRLGWESKETYYTNLWHCVQAWIFDDAVEEMIMHRHADGRKLSEICRELESMGDSRHRHTVRLIIRKFEMKWGIKSYTESQLNPVNKKE